VDLAAAALTRFAKGQVLVLLKFLSIQLLTQTLLQELTKEDLTLSFADSESDDGEEAAAEEEGGDEQPEAAKKPGKASLLSELDPWTVFPASWGSGSHSASVFGGEQNVEELTAFRGCVDLFAMDPPWGVLDSGTVRVFFYHVCFVWRHRFCAFFTMSVLYRTIGLVPFFSMSVLYGTIVFSACALCCQSILYGAIFSHKVSVFIALYGFLLLEQSGCGILFPFMDGIFYAAIVFGFLREKYGTIVFTVADCFVFTEHDTLTDEGMLAAAMAMGVFGSANFVALIACSWQQLDRWRKVLAEDLHFHVHKNLYISVSPPNGPVAHKMFTPRSVATFWVNSLQVSIIFLGFSCSSLQLLVSQKPTKFYFDYKVLVSDTTVSGTPLGEGANVIFHPPMPTSEFCRLTTAKEARIVRVEQKPLSLMEKLVECFSKKCTSNLYPTIVFLISILP